MFRTTTKKVVPSCRLKNNNIDNKDNIPNLIIKYCPRLS